MCPYLALFLNLMHSQKLRVRKENNNMWKHKATEDLHIRGDDESYGLSGVEGQKESILLQI